MRTLKGDMNTCLKKGAWSLEEDRKLIAYISRYGIWNWSHMPKFAGLLRSGKSCRLRWMNYLKPDLKKGSFTEDEERSILHFHSILGNRWSAIARKLPGRSDNEIKNYWHTNLKKREKLIKQKEINLSPCFESHNLENIQDNANHANDITNYLFSWSTPEENDSSATNTPTQEVHQLEYEANNIGSPGTVEEDHCFWSELYPLEDLELGNIDQEMYLDHIFKDSYDDPIVPWSFYNNEYDITPNGI